MRMTTSSRSVNVRRVSCSGACDADAARGLSARAYGSGFSLMFRNQNTLPWSWMAIRPVFALP
jgi:hypothetical protein